MRILGYLQEKIKGLPRNVSEKTPLNRAIQDDVFLGLIIILVAFGSFGLGRLSKIEGSKVPIRIENAPEVTAETFATETTLSKSNTERPPTGNEANDKALFGSKNGTKYYYSWCSGAGRIIEVNRVYFASITDAQAQGYTPASNCKGL